MGEPSKGRLVSTDAMKSLADRLERISQVHERDKPGQSEAWTLVHALSDIEDSCHEYLERFLPQLANDTVEGESLLAVLVEVAGELRHIVYHSQDSEFLRPLVTEGLVSP